MKKGDWKMLKILSNFIQEDQKIIALERLNFKNLKKVFVKN